MNTNIDTIRNLRNFILAQIAQLTVDQLNEIPPGFNNNIIWNMGHLVAAQQIVCYKRSGLPMLVSDDFHEAYKPSSKPTGFVAAEEVGRIKTLITTSIDQLGTNLQTGTFKTYMPLVTRYGITLNSVDDAVDFIPFHDGFHIGYMLALKRIITA